MPSKASSGPVPKDSTQRSDGRWHRTQQGQSVTSIAAANGLSAANLLQHSANLKLKDHARQPNMLLPDDWVFIPNIETKRVSAASDARVTFRKDTPTHSLKFRLSKGARPRNINTLNNPKPINYRLEIDGTDYSGSAMEGELVEIPGLAATAEKARLHLYGRIIDLTLRGLDPDSEPSGMEQRLHALGYAAGEQGLEMFKRLNQLDPNADLEQVQTKLRQLHEGEG